MSESGSNGVGGGGGKGFLRPGVKIKRKKSNLSVYRSKAKKRLRRSCIGKGASAAVQPNTVGESDLDVAEGIDWETDDELFDREERVTLSVLENDVEVNIDYQTDANSSLEDGQVLSHCQTVHVVGDSYKVSNDAIPPSETVSMNENDIDDHTANQELSGEEKYLEKCIRELSDRTTVEKLVKRLHHADVLRHYMNHFHGLASGHLSPLTLAVLLGLERVTWQTLSSTTNMRYHSVTRKFFAIGSRLFGGAFINYLSGEKNFGQVTSNITKKGRYAPDKSKINFAVPTKKYLHLWCKELPKLIPPGLIPQAFDIVRDRSDLMLLIDGKKVARGLKDDFQGDVHLWGHKKPLPIVQVKEKMSRQLNFVDSLLADFMSMSDDVKAECLETLINVLGKHIKHVCERQLVLKKRLNTFTTKSSQPGNVKRYGMAISKCKTFLYRSYLWVNKSLACVNDICELLAHIQCNASCLKTKGHVVLTERSNFRLLLPPADVEQSLVLQNNTRFVKQRSTEWFTLRQHAFVMGSTAFNALGLRSGKALQEHLDEFVRKMGPPHRTPEVQQRLTYGSENEVRN